MKMGKILLLVAVSLGSIGAIIWAVMADAAQRASVPSLACKLSISPESADSWTEGEVEVEEYGVYLLKITIDNNGQDTHDTRLGVTLPNEAFLASTIEASVYAEGFEPLKASIRIKSKSSSDEPIVARMIEGVSYVENQYGTFSVPDTIVLGAESQHGTPLGTKIPDGEFPAGEQSTVYIYLSVEKAGK